MNISSVLPSSVLSDYIERIWFINGIEEETELLIPPNQYVNIVFPIGDSIYIRNGVTITTPQIEGITLESLSLRYPKGTQLMGIRLYAYGLSPFFTIDGKEIINTSVPLSKVYPQYHTLNELTEVGSNTKEVLANIESWLLSIRNSSLDIELVKNFYQHFRYTEGVGSIEEFCKNQQSNYTTLNRYFSRIVGISPKRFERLIKFRRSLCQLIDSENNFSSIGHDAGYFDQAHFIREFKLFLNTKPSVYQKLIKTADRETNVINYNFRLL